MSKYSEDLDYLIMDVDISATEIDEIIIAADRIISGLESNAEKRTEAYLKKVQCLQKLNKYSESEVFVHILLEFNPNMPEALVRMGNICAINKQYDKSIDYMQKAIESKKDYAYAYCMKACSHDDKKEYSNALQDYSTAILYKPDYAAAFNSRGWTYNNMFEYDKAIIDFNKSLGYKPNYKHSLSGKGFAYLYKNDNDNAIKYYTQAIEADNTQWHYFYFRAQAYENKTEYGEALADIDRTLELEKDDKDIIRELKSKKYDLLGQINDEWEITRTRFVAYFDILGFKNFVLRNKHENVFEKLDSLLKEIKTQANRQRYFVHVVSFSDSIVLFSRDDTPESLKAMITLSKSLMVKALQNEIPIKGAGAYGCISVDKTNQIFCGQPIIDAFLFQEEQLHYYGVVFLHSFEVYIKENTLDFMTVNQEDECKNSIIEIRTPIKKGGSVNHLNLNWFSSLSGAAEFSDIMSKLKMTPGADGDIRKYIDNTIEIYTRLYPQNRISSFKENMLQKEVMEILKSTNYKSFFNLKIKGTTVSFLSIAYADSLSGETNEILIIGDILVYDSVNIEEIRVSISKLNYCVRQIQDLFDETLADITIDMKKMIVLQDTNIDNCDIQSLISESDIIFANLCKQQDNYLAKVLPESKECTNDGERTEFNAYAEYIETVINYFSNI